MPLVPATEEAIVKAAQALARGEIVAFPTETVYGLGADAREARAVAAVFAAKERPRFNPLIVHVPDLAAAEQLAVFGPEARRLAEAFWPGPLSLVLPKRPGSGLSDLVTAGLETVAVRVPAAPVARALLAKAALPVAAPSANRSGRISPTEAAHVANELDEVPAFILDDGPCDRGIESTVVSLVAEGPAVLRLGAVARSEIEAVLGKPVALAAENGPVTSPGRLARHYAPETPLRLDAASVRDNEVLLAFGQGAPVCRRLSINLSERGDLREAAAKLFSALRALDAAGAAGIAVMPIPDEGLGEAINDRLRRAAKAR